MLARQHDELSGGRAWREVSRSELYDYREIGNRYESLRQYLDSGSTQELLYALNEGVHGNMGGMGRPVLYERARCGTKQLIEDYVSAIAEAMLHINRSPDSEIPYAEKLDFFRRASHCYGRSALLLSGGGGLIYAHHGVVQELIDNDMLPRVISGSSAGAVVAAQLGTLTDEELKAGYFIDKRYHELERTRLRDQVLGRTHPDDAKQSLERLLDEIIPRDITFQEAFEKTGRYINISISPAGRHQNSRLMNAITSPNVYVRAAVSASSSIPGVVPAERLFAKGFDGKPRPYLANRRWVDGSVSGELPTKRLARLYGVNHFVVSMINPAVVPFISDIKTRQQRGIKSAVTAAAIQVAHELLLTAELQLNNRGRRGQFIASQLKHLSGVLDQDYLGDINILMEKSDFKWRQTLFEFQPGEIEALILAGRRKTWPKLAMMRNAALISGTLDRILGELDKEGLGQSKHHLDA